MTNPYAEPTQASDPEPPRPVIPGVKKAGTARRIAGGFLILNAVMVLIEAAVLPPEPGMRSPAFSFGPAIFDIVIGATLLRGNPSLAVLAIVRAILGAALGIALRFDQGPVLIVYQLVFCAGIVGLLAGEAERPRMAVAGSAVTLCVLLEMVGVLTQLTGGNILAPYTAALSGDIDMPAVRTVEGRTAPYQLTFPNDRWFERKRAVAEKENPLADRWFVRPDKDAHIIVIAEHAPGSILPIENYVDAVLDNTKKAGGAQITSRGAWPAFPENGRLVSAKGKREGIDIEWRYALVTVYERAFYVVGLSSAAVMPSVEAEMRQVFDSFKLPAPITQALPADLDPTPVRGASGQLLPYTIAVPEGRWYRRKSEVVRASSEVIDVWLQRPDLDAHVLVVAEKVDPKLQLPLEPYAASVLDNARNAATRFDELRREPWAKFPKNGLRVRVSLAQDAIELEYDYGIYTRGNIAFQVVAFTSKSSFPAAEKELARIIDSFEPPP